MNFIETAILGAFIVELSKLEDERGHFARAFCKHEFEAMGMNSEVVQANVSHNKYKGTLRGMHYQVAPVPETKLVRCVRGSIEDVIVDLRPDSPTFRQHISVTLSHENGIALFVPSLCAHGFMTLEDDTDVMYMVSGFYTPDCERGLRHDDPILSINWPMSAIHQSDKDKSWPLLPTTH